MEIISWNKYPEKHTNFICEIRNTGLWEDEIFGKWLCLFKPDNKCNKYGEPITAPTYYDVKNLLSALLEVEKRNDDENYIYGNNKKRPKEKYKKLNEIMFLCSDILDKWIHEEGGQNGC